MRICKLIAPLACVVVLTACQSSTVISTENYNPQQHARIRLYGQNQKPSIMEYSIGNKKVEKNVGGSLGDAFSSLVGTAENVSLGMPKTPMLNEMHNYDGILSKVFYREFVIPAGVPVRVNNAFVGLGSSAPHYASYYYEASCRSNTAVFTPQAGRDYEVVPLHNSRDCGVAVLDITSTKPPVQ